jgi:hypothetical protein
MTPQPSSPPERQTVELTKHLVFDDCLRMIRKVFVETLNQAVQLASVIGERITLTQSNIRNRPFINPSRGRSIRQGGRMGDKHRRYKTCQ